MPIIKVSALSKTYRQGRLTIHALRNVNLSIDKQDIYGVIGLSGAGKSTLIRCLSGLIKPTSGTVAFNATDIHQLRDEDLRNLRMNMGMIFQQFNLLSSRDVARNIAYPLEIAGVSKEAQDKRIDELLHLVGLSSKKEAYPASLSGGEKQRVGIARALANHPEVLFCDEATSALDPRTTREILDLLIEINKQLEVTIVLITHDMEVIKKSCNKVAVIDSGIIVEEGPVHQVFAEPKHLITKHFIQGTSHEIPEEFFKPFSSKRRLVRLSFKGDAASQPLISEIVKKYQVDINILLGWIDRLRTSTVGTLIVEITGTSEGISDSLKYLEGRKVKHEELKSHEF